MIKSFFRRANYERLKLTFSYDPNERFYELQLICVGENALTALEDFAGEMARSDWTSFLPNPLSHCWMNPSVF